MARGRTAARRGPGEANGCGAGAEVPWEGLNRWSPGCLGAERPAPRRLGVAGQVSLSRPHPPVPGHHDLVSGIPPELPR